MKKSSASMEARLQELQIWLAPDGNLYAGYVKPNGTEVKAQVDVTTRVIEAAVKFLEQNGGIEFMDGTRLVLIPPDSVIKPHVPEIWVPDSVK